VNIAPITLTLALTAWSTILAIASWRAADYYANRRTARLKRSRFQSFIEVIGALELEGEVVEVLPHIGHEKRTRLKGLLTEYKSVRWARGEDQQAEQAKKKLLSLLAEMKACVHLM
jgi:hypothetical protein